LIVHLNKKVEFFNNQISFRFTLNKENFNSMKTKEINKEKLDKIQDYKKTIKKLVRELLIVEEGVAFEYDAKLDIIGRKLNRLEAKN
jgi:hypothetical protein